VFLNLLLMLTGLVITVLTPVFIGHGLSTHHIGPILLGIACVIVGPALLVAYTRIADRLQGESTGH
jgi:hypothetical protein